MSEYLMDQKQYEQRVERLNLILSSLFGIMLLQFTDFSHIAALIFGFYLFVVIFGWSFYLTSAKNYMFRAQFLSIGIELNILFYSIYSGNFSGYFPLIICNIVMIGLYEIPHLVMIGWASYGIMILYHLLISHSIAWDGSKSNVYLILQIGSGVVAEGVIYFMSYAKRQVKLQQKKTIEELQQG